MREDAIALLRTEVARMVEMPEEEIGDSIHFADLGMDSLQALKLLVLIERTYKLEIGEEDLKYFTSIEAVADYVSSRTAIAATA